jgi:hypothetical protein
MDVMSVACQLPLKRNSFFFAFFLLKKKKKKEEEEEETVLMRSKKELKATPHSPSMILKTGAHLMRNTVRADAIGD